MPGMRRVLPLAALSLAACSTVIHHWRPRAEDPRWRRTPGFVSLGATWSCARLHDGDTDCWGRRAGSRYVPKPTFWSLQHEAREFVVNGERLCVGDVDDNLICDEGELRFADVWHYDTRGAWVCVAWRCGGVSCSDGGAIVPVVGLDEYVDEIYLREDGVGLAVVHDRVFVWEPKGGAPLRAKAMPALDPWTAYVVARTCLDSSIEACAARPLPPVAALQTLHNVDLERSYGCGLDDAGRVACVWYGKEQERAQAARFFSVEEDALVRGELVPIGDFRARSFDVGGDHACAIDEHEIVHCWGGRNEDCQAESPRLCGRVKISPFYENVWLSIPASDVAAGETKTYATKSADNAEVVLTVTDLEFERLAAGETVEVGARFFQTDDGVEREHPDRLQYWLRCVPVAPPVHESCA